MKATGIDHSQSIAKTVWDAVPSLLLIVIVIGGIVSRSSPPLRAQVSRFSTA